MNWLKPFLRRIAPACAVLLSAGSLLALDPAKSVYQYNCQNWTRQNGLPADLIIGVTQTKDGYIWLGTQQGLVRFDGIDFKVMNIALPPGQSQEIRSLNKAKDGGLWLSINRGNFGFYDGQRFSAIEDQRWSGTSTEATPVFEASDGAVWTGSDYGLGRWVKGKPLETFIDEDYKSHVLSICEGPRGRVWVGTAGQGLLYWQDGKLVLFPDDSLKNDNIFTVAEGLDGKIWVGTGNNLLCYDSKFQPVQISGFSSGDRIIVVDRHGVVWIGTAGGLVRYYNGEFTCLRKTDGLVSDAVTSLYEDSEGSLWVGTQNGLSQITDVKFPIYSDREGLPSSTVVSVSAARNGGLWITTDRGLAWFDGQKVTSCDNNPSFPQGWFKRVFEASNGNLYLADSHKQLLMISGGEIGMTYTNQNWPAAMAEDAESVIVAVADRIFRLRNGRLIPYSYTGGTEPTYYWILNLCVARDGAIWVASNNGIFRIKNGIARQWSTAEGLSGHNVSCIFEDVDGAVWAGLASGIARIRDDHVKNITSEHGLANNNIYEIVPDNQGNFWMDSGVGILRASRQSLNDVADGKTNHVVCEVFDGLDSIKFTGHAKREPVAGKTADGRIWFPNPDGLAMIDPAHLLTNSVVPPVLIQQIRINGIEVQDRKVPALSVGGGRMEFHFAVLSYIAPQKAKLRYQLEGFDKDWVDAEGRHSVLYNNLKPGKYSFRVQGCNADGVWNTAGDTFAVELPPAFYQTTWFLVLCILVGLAGLGLVYRWMLYRAESKQRRLKEANDLLELKVRERTAFFEALVESSPDGILVDNNERKKILQNQQMIELWQIPRHLVEGNDDADLANYFMNMARYPEQFRADVSKLYAHPNETDRREIELKNGTVLDRYSSSVTGKDGRCYGRIWTFRNITEHKRLHQQLMVASRQAGMADVATGVLHNVGNVLNSVNVSANLVVDSVRRSRASSLAKVVDLLDKHQTDLAEFLTRDEKGKQLHGFLAGLNDHLAAERAALLEELRSLTANIEHIKEIVAMQQANAHRFGVMETAQAAELMENALKMNEAAYSRHNVGLVREFEEVPPILVDKHKVMQILINLLQNAKRACCQSTEKDRRVKVCIRRNGESAIRMEVADNGVGIPPENLTRIFAHGFTTQADGHGFGLHSGALAAKQLGGTLTAHSEGSGKGTTFILELPLQNATSEQRAPASGGLDPAPALHEPIDQSRIRRPFGAGMFN
jgi:ligand-binding sensor domain-containing protein/signal transduction histidine kinase/PAS domain-containing protein